MSATEASRQEFEAILDLAAREARSYLARVDEMPVRSPGADAAAARFRGPLPDSGDGGLAALKELLDKGREAMVANSGPRYFHFVIGGTTPAALGADWMATLFDQLPSGWITSPLAVQLELQSIDWLKELFELPAAWGGVMTTGATMANFTCLAAARQWCGERMGVDASQTGLFGLEPIPVFSSGYIHASAVSTLAMLGIGRDQVRVFAKDDVGRLDIGAMEAALAERGGRPTILVGNAGEVNAGDFDPIDELADLAARHEAWLHVDGAFGLFARVTPRAAHLAKGVERANSVTVDGHKWLNVPYDCGFAFVDDRALLAKNFKLVADYLPRPDDPAPIPSMMTPESSRRARSFSVWATLRAYGREGHRAMVERHLDLAQRMARLVDEAPDLERLAEVPLNIVSFRYNPGSAGDEELDAMNERLGRRLLGDGRVYVGTTRYRGRVALRPAIVNWRTRDEDIDFFVDVVRELGAKVSGETPRR